jgi:ankyrin repeat protein
MHCNQDGTALIMASQDGHDEIVKLLLSRSDIAVNSRFNQGATALMLASQNGRDAVVKLLLCRSGVAVT